MGRRKKGRKKREKNEWGLLPHPVGARWASSVVLVFFSSPGTGFGKQLGHLAVDFTYRVEWDEDWVKSSGLLFF